MKNIIASVTGAGKRLNPALIDLNPGFAKAFNRTPPFLLTGVDRD